MTRSVAILYAADGYVSQGRAMLGRRVAGDSFLNGLLRHGRLESLVGLMLNDNEAKGFPAEIQARAPGLQVRIKSGPLRGTEAWVESRSKMCDVHLRLDFIGKAVVAKVQADDLELV